MPIYPVLASFVHDNTLTDFYRGDIDESTILESYLWVAEDGLVVENKDSFLTVNTLVNNRRDVTWVSEVVMYDVKPWDSIARIAEKFWVTRNSILWANNLWSNSVIQPGDVLKVPPVSGVIHTVASGETLSTIAKKYGIDEKIIKQQNNIGEDSVVVKWKALVIPGAEKIEVIKPAPPKVLATAKWTSKISNSWNSDGGYTFSWYAASEYVSDGGSYELVKRKPQHTFYWGNCTWFVAQYKNVNWWGNAKDWLKNAANKWHDTGSTPTLGSIVVFFWKGYNPRYGHVWIVTEVSDSHIIVKDMNYRKLNEVTVRKVPKNDGAIKWYIYVD